jgi:hypothetical protein
VELRTLKHTIRIFFFLLTVFSFSCEKPLFVQCNECVADEPLKADLKMNLDHYNYGVSTLINVYTGNLEDGIIYRTIQTQSDQTSVSVTLNQKYTVTATYYIDGTDYIAVDSATPRVTYNKDQCTDPCYFIYDREVNLRLKFTK